MARLSAFSRELEVMVDRALSPRARSTMIADVARRALSEAQAQNRAVLGIVPAHESFVDGSRSSALETVNPDRGVIAFEFNVQFDMFDYIGRMLLDHAPFLTGEFASSIKLYADGVEVAGFDPQNMASEWVFTTAVPYARKIERGASDQAPDGVFEAVAALANRRYGNVARIRFSYRSPLLAYVPGGANRAARRALKSQPARQSAMRLERATRSPAIVVTLR